MRVFLRRSGVNVRCETTAMPPLGSPLPMQTDQSHMHIPCPTLVALARSEPSRLRLVVDTSLDRAASAASAFDASSPKDVPTSTPRRPPARPRWSPCARSNDASPTSSTPTCSPINNDVRRRAREGNKDTTLTPARPAHIPTPALRTSHFPDPSHPSLGPPSSEALDLKGSHERMCWADHWGRSLRRRPRGHRLQAGWAAAPICRLASARCIRPFVVR